MYHPETALRDAHFFIDLVQKNGLKITAAYLFGSVARKSHTEESDIDIALVSPDFTGFGFDDLGKTAPSKLRSNPDLEIHPFKESLFTADDPFAAEIMRTGIKLEIGSSATEVTENN